MKKAAVNARLAVLFLLGAAFLLYPPLSRIWNSRTCSRTIAEYILSCEMHTPQDSRTLIQAAESYNTALSQLADPLMDFRSIEGYETLLNTGGDGMIGYLTIEKIKLEIPVYHGTSPAVLQIAAGHLQGSSLPVGGSSTHCVLSAHSGMPNARLFTDLNQMEPGDIFSLAVLDQKLIYRVEEIRTVDPQDRELLAIIPGKDLCTLMTCTPYGVNSHRLLVRGCRLTTPEEVTQ